MEATKDDVNVVKRAQEGDVNAVAELYDRFQPAIFRYVRARIYDHQIAQEITGDVFLRMVEGLPNYRVMDVPFLAWLYRIAHNQVVNHIRKETNQPVEPLDAAAFLAQTDGNPTVIVEQKLELQRLLRALEHLDAPQREVLILRFLVGMPLKDVAEALGKTLAAVKTLQHRGTLALQVALK